MDYIQMRIIINTNLINSRIRVWFAALFVRMPAGLFHSRFAGCGWPVGGCLC